MENETSSISHNKLTRINPPKLRRNKRIETRWGEKYYDLVKETVFLVRTKPVAPAEPPPSLRDEGGYCEPVYVCKVCKDCFLLRSSLEDHMSRRSWILGYWCHTCFFTNCPHKSEHQSPCLECQGINRGRIVFLKSKGLKKGFKLGRVKIFYNQCQFFAHLKIHLTSYVDMSEVMLMPLPLDVDKEFYNRLNHLCETIMERMFLKRIHIMDWLKSQELDNNWWKSFLKRATDYQENKLDEMFSATGINHVRKKSVKRNVPKTQKSPVSQPEVSPGSSSVTHHPTADDSASITEPSESVAAETSKEQESLTQSAKMKNARSLLSAYFNRSQPTEGDGNPQVVDCASSTKRCPSKVKIVSTSKDNSKISPMESSICGMAVKVVPVKSDGKEMLKMSGSPLILQHGWVPNVINKASANVTPIANLRPILPKIGVKECTKQNVELFQTPCQKNLVKPGSGSNVKKNSTETSSQLKKKITEDVKTPKKVTAQNALSGFGSKIVTLHRPSNADLSKIISQLPPNVINGKKLVFIGQDSDRFTLLPKNDAPPSKLEVLANVRIDQSIKSPPDTLEVNSKPKMLQLPKLEGKLIYQNGKKFVIRPLKKTLADSSIINNVNNIKPAIVLSKEQSLSITAVKSVDTEANKIPAPVIPSASHSCAPSTSEDSQKSKSIVQMERNGNHTDNVDKKSRSQNSVRLPMLRNHKNSDAVHFFIKSDEAGKSYVHFANTKGPTIVQPDTNYRQNMLERLRRLGCERQKQYMDHLMETNAELMRMSGVIHDVVISENLKAIEALKNAVVKEPLSSEGDEEDADQEFGVDAVDRIFTNLEETRTPRPTCPTCNRSTETKSDVLQFARGPDFKLGCQSCNKYTCHICDVFQGNGSRFRAHLKLHSKSKPFMCPECFRKFPSYEKLEVHMWTDCFHFLTRRWFKCRICKVEGFPDMDSVTTHFILAHTKSKLACAECGLLLKSHTDFKKHRTEEHPKSVRLLKPVEFMVCDIGECVVRLKNYRTHMDHHAAVINMSYYKCSFCSFIIECTKKNKEQMKSHLHLNHLDQLLDLISPESLHDLVPVKHRDKTSKIFSDRLLNRKEYTVELEQDSENSHHTSNSEEAVVAGITNTSESDEPCKCLDANSPNQRLKDDVGRRGHSESSERLKITTGDDVPKNVLNEYSSSPKIFDVRSVTPDSYAELHRDSKGQVNVSLKADENVSDSVTGSLVKNSQAQSADSILVKMVEKILPTELIGTSTYADLSPSMSEIASGSKTETNVPELVRIEPKDSASHKKAARLRGRSNKIAVAAADEKEANVASLCDIPKPPPLARIPESVLQLSQTEDRVKGEEVPETPASKQRSPTKLRAKQKRPWKIALNSPNCSSEYIDYNCHLCGELINTSWSTLRSHFSSRHSSDYRLSVLTPRLLRMSDDFIAEGYKESLGSRKRKSDGTVSNSKRRKRWNPKKHLNKHPFGPGLCVEQESVQDGEGNFICKKCNLRCDDISSLRTHIGTHHRIKDHYLVCLECGENFVVEPSLRMHLKAFHCVQDPCEYMEQHTEYIKKMPETTDDEVSTGIANQCHVCMAVFEDKLAVDKHLRVHGMAFLNRKRIEARMAARNPEKKIRVEKLDDGSAAVATEDKKIEEPKPEATVVSNEEAKHSEIMNTSVF